MDVSGINSSQNLASFQEIQQEFQQLGTALQSGNLTEAQQDYATLSANLPSGQQSGDSTSTNSPSQLLSEVGQALQNGDLTAAQQAFSTFQQDIQQGPSMASGQDATTSSQSSSESAQQSALEEELNALAQALQSNNLTAAQQAFSTLNQSLQSPLSYTGTGESAGSTTSVMTSGSNLDLTA